MKAGFLFFLAAGFLAWGATDARGEPQGAGFTFEAPVHIEIDTLSMAPFPMFAYLTNTGDAPDTFDVVMERDVPDTTWTTLLCTQGTCYPEFVMSAVEVLGVGEYDSLMDVSFITASLNPESPRVEGAGYASLTVTSRRDPSLTKTLHFTFISEGTEIVVVDDDGEKDYERYYEEAIGATHIQGTWSRNDQAPTEEDLSHFGIVVWETGDDRVTMDAEDRQALAGYLESGRRLFVSGQDIGFSLADPASPEYSEETLAFYNTYLHADYLGDNAADHTLSGVPGDPISDGLSLVIEGGDGANNQTSPDAVAPSAGGVEVLEYEPGIAGALRAGVGGHKVVYMAFGFEAVNSQLAREELMARTIDWLLAPIGIEDDEPTVPLPRQVGLSQNYPNPFNPSTVITVVVPGKPGEAVDAMLAIHTLRGRVVRILHEGAIPAGTHSFTWDGRDDAGRAVPSGAYLYRISSGEGILTRKMLLVK